MTGGWGKAIAGVVGLLFAAIPGSGKAQDQVDWQAHPDWVSQFALSYAANHLSQGCLAGDEDDCQQFRDVWEFGHRYAVLVIACTESGSSDGPDCVQRRQAQLDIAAWLDADPVLAQILTLRPEFGGVMSFTPGPACVEGSTNPDPACLRHQQFLELLQE